MATHLLRVSLLLLSFQPFMVQPRILKPTSAKSLNYFLQNPNEIQEPKLTAKDLAQVRNYLKTFGYLLDNQDNSNLESAIKRFQKHYNLKVSGKLDLETIKLMSLPRCGVSDNPMNQKINLEYTFFPGALKWPLSKTHLTYSFISGVEVVSIEIMRYVSEQTFGKWSKVSGFSFEETANVTSSDIVLGFFRGNHGCAQPFDGPGNVLAHAYAPTDGRLHFDADEKWSTDMPPQADEIDLVWVAMHELGHVLGLEHSTDPNAIMYPFVSPGINKRDLGTDDIAGIKALYS